MDLAIFYYKTYLLDDGQHYNTWLDELKDKYPFFQTQKLEASSAGCMLTGHPNVTFITAKLTKMGGFYFSEHTMIAHFSQILRNLSFIDRYDVDNEKVFYMSSRGFPGQLTVDEIMKK